MNAWTIFSNHGHVLVCLAQNPQSRLRDVAADVGITERAVQKIVRDLQDEGMVSVTKHGRRNHYRIHHKQTLRHDLESHCTLGELVKFIGPSKTVEEPAAEAAKVANAGEQKEPPAARPVEPAVTKPAPAKPEVAETKAQKPKVENSIEKQQGSLF